MRPQPGWVLILVLAAFVLAISAVGWCYWKNQQRAFEQGAESELAAVADLKVAQIGRWREERLADANLLLEATPIQAAAQEFLAQPANAQARAQLLAWMSTYRRHSYCMRVVLLDSNLQPRLAIPENESWVGPIAAKLAGAALQTNRVLISDLHISQVSGRFNMDLLIPLVPTTPEPHPPSAAPGLFLVEIEPTEFLFPNLQTWPTRIRTAETLLVRREGDEVVYLNELRHRTNTALRLRVSLAKAPDLPAARAVLGQEDVVRGKDYRGEPVLAALRRIAGTPWFLVAKRDEAEIRKPLKRQAWMISGIVEALILASTLGVLLVWRNREYRFSLLELEARARTEEILRHNAERFRSFTAATFEGICLSEHGRILDLNDQLAAMLGYERDELVGREILSLIAPNSRPLVGEAILTDRETIYEHQLMRKDGSVFDAEAQAKVSLWEGRRVRVTALRDITERKRAEEKLKQTQGELLHASRMAGMAEVAAGVLHNVGNVLNSINVSITLVSDQMKQSKIANLARAAAMMHDHTSDLVAYLTQDPKGKMLPAYFGQLAEYLGQEQSTLLKELEGLRKNVEHIRDIVAMQQSYAKVAGTVEMVKVAELVEDALRLNTGTLECHAVQVVRDYDPAQLPEIMVAKHKVLQILVNLIRNAKYACDESGRSDKRLTMRVSTESGRVKISVTDNGVGIPAENLPRLFTHGFTTRKEGHGFGLHSSLLAAKALGGTLSAQSDGPGKGASFTLELPRHAQSITPPV